MMIHKIRESAEFIKEKMKFVPEIAIILGSGLGDFVETFESCFCIDYKDIPNFPVSTVKGHKGKLVFGEIGDKKVCVMQGRFHFYEGYSMSEVVFPVFVLKELGIKILIITNAAGALNDNFKIGDLVLIKDHINLVLKNPLIELKDLEKYYGERFIDMSEAYNRELVKLAKETAEALGIELKEGVYMAFTGPSYETPSEIKAAKILGADLVGMSTIPEVIVSNYIGLKVVAISSVTNMAAGMAGDKLNHLEVIKNNQLVKDKFNLFLKNLIINLSV